MKVNDPLRTVLRQLPALILAAFYPWDAAASVVSDGEIVAAMKKAATFMSEEVARHGGHVYVVSEDLEERWGEVRARPSQIWLQGATERVGQLMLDVWQVTNDDYYLGVARKAADAVVYGQQPQGGWHYFIDFDPTGLPAWYENQASKFRWGYEEYRYFYGNATFDDRATQDAARFLLNFYTVTREAAYRTPLLRALDFVLEAQYPNGAWPQRYPLRDGFPDYTGYYTLNDGAAQSNIELLLDAYTAFGDPRYFKGARLGIAALIELQGPEKQGCWAEQYDLDMRPATARTHEPAGYVVRESTGVISLLFRIYLLTGDREYLSPIPRCIDWFERINLESAAEKYPRPRYWEPGTNRPLYVVRTENLTAEGYGVYEWTTDPRKVLCDGLPCKGDSKPIVDLSTWSDRFNQVSSLESASERDAYLAAMLDEASQQSRQAESVVDILAALDHRGAWISGGIRVNEPNGQNEQEAHPRIRGISTQVFVRRMYLLLDALQQSQDYSRATVQRE